ncbi:MAG: DUF445 domain-containing protein [Acidimicrobiia bacterium]|nr:DUF445 domain-containing protein [Acidimicrobiia bacterium]
MNDTNRVSRLATGLLVLMTIIFMIALWVEQTYSWVGFIRATAEASMVGALADWFAVTALFRHTLGLKIPHTAIIPSRKDQLGRALGSFMKESFLSPDNIETRIRDIDVSQRISDWLGQPGAAHRMAVRIADGLGTVAGNLDDDRIAEALRTIVVERLRSLPITPLVREWAALATGEGRIDGLLDSVMPYFVSAIASNEDRLETALSEASPWWVPRQVDAVIMQQAVDVVARFAKHVAEDPDHPFRGTFASMVDDQVQRLESDPLIEKRLEEFKEELVQHPAVQGLLDGVWQSTKSDLQKQAEAGEGELVARIEEAVTRFASSLRKDEDLRRRIDDRVLNISRELVERFEEDVSNLVEATVASWDTDETTKRIENLIGRDLQFIRISGTVVGGVAGLVIYTLSQLVS